MKKKNFEDISGALNRDEMKKIMAGSGGNPTCGIACSGGCRPSSDGCSKCGSNGLCQS